VLEALGVKIDLPPEGVARCIDQAGMGFCFAPAFHPAFRYAGAPRRELGTPTIFNFLGPLTNPAGARRQAMGVSDARMLHKMVETLGRLGSERVLAFHGDHGLDELAISGPSRIVELVDGDVREWTLDPRDLGIDESTLDDVAGGTPDENATAIRAVLNGEKGPRRDIVALNAAAGLVAAGRAGDVKDALSLAREAIDSGAGNGALEQLIEVSNA
jgi:anthranilate phosphoribosyltransferase